MKCAWGPCHEHLTAHQMRKKCRYHSNSCAKRGRAAPRPICAACHVSRVARKGSKYCSRSCTARMQRPHIQAALARCREIHHAKVYREVIAGMYAAMQGFAGEDGRVAVLDAVKAGVKVAVKYRQEAYLRGYSTCWHRVRSSAKRKARFAVDAWRQPA